MLPVPLAVTFNVPPLGETTVLLLDKQHKVLFNQALRAPERQDFDEVRKAIDKLLGPSPVPFPRRNNVRWPWWWNGPSVGSRGCGECESATTA